MGITQIITYHFNCESMELILEDAGKGRKISNYCYGRDEYENIEQARIYGWKIISEDKVFCPYCSKPENIIYIENLLKNE